MLFNSLDFALFLPAVFILYWLATAKNLKLQNLLIVAASYFFYGWWDWRFLGLIFLSTCVDFLIAKKIQGSDRESVRKKLLFTSIIVNLGILASFKYFDFFSKSFGEAFTFFGGQFDALTLNIILPIGISFYTFQTLGYTIDVYRKKLKPAEDFVGFMAFVCFFPQLVAGPIERAVNLLPQFYTKRTFNYLRAVDGLRQILWGLFKKVVIADGAAEYANLIFNNHEGQTGSTLALGCVFFAFQIYGDFSGYSDIAIGTSRLFGFDLKRNFHFPYFSRDIAEFWRRWHISLSTWFRDYLYIPLGGSRVGVGKKVRNTFVIFLVSGFWHGANWTFIIWGGLHAIYFLPYQLANLNRKNLEPVATRKLVPSFRELSGIVFTFALASFAWIFFRAESVPAAFSYIQNMFSVSLFTIPTQRPTILLGLILTFIVIEWIGKNREYAIEKMGAAWPRFFRLSFYMVITLTVLLSLGKKIDFIYFQF